jgi:hypothetical protein
VIILMIGSLNLVLGLVMGQVRFLDYFNQVLVLSLNGYPKFQLVYLIVVLQSH